MRLCIPQSIARSRKPILAVVMAQRRSNSSGSGAKDFSSAVLRPSASVILVSPTNKILLLHRVQTSSAFPSAYVFAGGNLSAYQDGEIPAADSPARHLDSDTYRRAAIRETFEESGILLAKRHKNDTHLISVRDSKRERIRKAVHANELKLTDWLTEIGAEPDIDGLIPFTRWITPANIPKRFTTQMYIYFLPLAEDDDGIMTSGSQIPVPTSDGGIEHTTAEFHYASDWLSLANSKSHPRTIDDLREDIIMFPPQFFLLSLLAPLLPQPKDQQFHADELSKQRDDVRAFLKTSQPPWGDKCISPYNIGVAEDGRAIVALDKPGLAELIRDGRQGDPDRVLLVKFIKAGPTQIEVRWKRDVPKDQLKPASKL